MPTDTIAQIQTSELTQVVESVWSTMLNLEVVVCDTPWYQSADHLTATVQLSGHWNGAAILECNRRQACVFAACFLSMDVPDAVDDDVRDVLGELANMIGGNLKALFASGIHLSIPTVADGSDFSLRVCGSKVDERIAFQCGDGRFWVSLLSMPVPAT